MKELRSFEGGGRETRMVYLTEALPSARYHEEGRGQETEK